jgi:hypothetical protein
MTLLAEKRKVGSSTLPLTTSLTSIDASFIGSSDPAC